MSRRFRIGFLLNPHAGLGGPAGLKGSDDRGSLDPILEETRYEDTPSVRRTVEAFSGAPIDGGVVVSAPGILGVEALKATIGRSGPTFEVFRLGVPGKPFGQTTAEDTRRFAAALADQDLDLLVFAGGDGTAVDVAQAVQDKVPILGIPTGVKMFSGVFAQSPGTAREVLNGLRPGFPTKEAEVLDLDEASYQQGVWKVRAHATARTPEDEAVQLGKGGSSATESEALADLVDWWHDAQEPGVLYILGAGTTTHALKRGVGEDGTALGVDAVVDGSFVATDADAPTLRQLVGEHGSARIVVSPTGGQGCVLGRGTAQIAPDVVEAVGPEHVVVVATPSKLNGVFELFVDTGDPDVDAAFPDYVRVRTDAFTEKMFRLRRGPKPPQRPW